MFKKSKTTNGNPRISGMYFYIIDLYAQTRGLYTYMYVYVHVYVCICIYVYIYILNIFFTMSKTVVRIQGDKKCEVLNPSSFTL